MDDLHALIGRKQVALEEALLTINYLFNVLNEVSQGNILKEQLIVDPVNRKLNISEKENGKDDGKKESSEEKGNGSVRKKARKTRSRC